MWKLLLMLALAAGAAFGVYRVWRVERDGQREARREAEREELEKAGFGAEALSEVQYFPLAEEEGKGSFSFEDGFGDERTYGGERKHEGTDIMTADGKVGYHPVVSMTDGVVDKVGWLELGGYRVGVRSPSGVYYYYAHLDSYAGGLEEGDEVKAGELLGFLGDSGYGEEGTRGQFEPHLHLGIYLTGADGAEIAVNPYHLLKVVEGRKVWVREIRK